MYRNDPCTSDSPIKPAMRSTGVPSRFNRFSPRQSGFETRIGPCIRVRLVALFFPFYLSVSLFLTRTHRSRELDFVSFNSRSCIRAHGPLIPAFVPLIFRYFCFHPNKTGAAALLNNLSGEFRKRSSKLFPPSSRHYKSSIRC